MWFIAQMPSARQLLLIPLIAVIWGCSDSQESLQTVIDKVAIENIRFGQLARFTLTGKNLDQEFSVSLSKCAGLAVVEGGSATSKTISCTISATGSATLFATYQGQQIFSQAFIIPEPQVSVKTGLGEIVIELNPTLAPITVSNFLAYVNESFYNNTLIHRVEKGFVVQGGWLDTTPAIKNPTRGAIALESNNGLSNLKGTVGMARTNEPNSATSQFYFNLADNVGLDYAQGIRDGYAVFGKIVAGLTVLEALGQVPIATRYGLTTFPATDIVISEVRQTQ